MSYTQPDSDMEEKQESQLDNSQASDIDIVTEQDMDEADEPETDADDISPEELKELERIAIREEAIEQKRMELKMKKNRKLNDDD